jgi:phosphoribosylaminoimidazole-succinocarboxamide synthase
MEKKALLYQGKAKSVYKTDRDDLYVLHYRNDATAFNALKKASLEDKGRVNNRFNAFIMEKLEQGGVKTHFVELLNDNESVVKSLDMIPVECVVRNYAAGSITKRLGIEKGTKLETPIFEFFYKDDALGDPMINDSHILTFGWATQNQIDGMKALTFKVNDILKKLFDDAGITLVDYKLEFGVSNGDIVLGDEFTPDGCRLWDKDTQKVMDKDRFRQDMGDVIETYKEVAARIGVPL